MYNPKLDDEYSFILCREVEQQLQFEDLINQKLIFIGDRGDEVYFCFECVVAF